jgi:23S rRNA (guanosine2251-2'-O)-methyltransferase
MNKRRFYPPKKTRETEGSSLQVIYGRHPVMDGLNNGQSFEKIFLQQGVRGEFEKELRKKCKVYNIPLQVIPKERFNKITKKNHQGVAGYAAAISYYKLEDIFPTIYEKGETPLIVLLDGVTDVRNLGAIARSAEACGAHTLVLPNKGGAMINEETIKVSAGALTTLPVCRTNSIGNAIDYLKLNGVTIGGADLRGEQWLHEADWNAPTAIVMGDERRGISDHLVAKLDACFKIPMAGSTNSFNVSVAAGIVLYEILKQRKF